MERSARSPTEPGSWNSSPRTKFRFNSSGRLTSQEDRNDNKLSFAYNGDGTLGTITDTHNRTVSFTYDGSKRITKMTDNAGGRIYSYVYGANGLLSDYYDPENVPTNSGARSTHFDYDGNGLLTRITDPLGNITKVGYLTGTRKVASITRVTDKTSLTGPTTDFSYDTANKKTTVEDPRNNPTTYTWEEKGRVTDVKDAKGNKRSTSYNSRSNVATYAEAGGITTPFSFGYDSTGNDVTKVTLPTAGFATVNYNENGAPPHFPTSIFDFQNRATNPKAGTTGYDRNKASYIYDYDSRGRLTMAKDGLGNVFTYDYNSNGTLKQITDARSNVTTFSYFASGDLQTITPPSPMGATRFTYDGVSRVQSVTDGAGHTATFTYDPLDRVTEIVYSDDGFVVYDHDLNGNLTSRRDDNSGTINFAYDALNRLTMETPPPPRGANKYEYDAAGNLTYISEQGSNPHLITTYTYDSVNMVTSVTDPNGAKTNFSYDDPRDTFRTKTVYPNGVTLSVTPDASTRIKEIKATNAAGQVLTKFTYSYNDGSGDTMLRQSVTDKAGVKTTYTYDPVNRLKTANLANTSGVDFSYAYDPNSNLISKTVLGATTTFSYDAANQLTKAGSTNYAYDGAGNLKSSTAGFSASYNAKNQTVSMTPSGGEAIPMTYQDASQDKRISASLTDFEYTVLGLSTQTDKGLSSGNNTFVDPENVQQLSLEKFDEAVEDLSLIVFGEAQSSEATQEEGSSTQAVTVPAETDATEVQADSATEDSGISSAGDQPTDAATGSVKKSTLWTKDNLGTLVSQRSASGTHYYLFDGLGSVVGLTDSSGRLVNTYKYDPYGKQTNAEQPVDNPWRFASGYTDLPTGFVKFGTRYYDPVVMRWTQRDPERGSVKDPLSLNPYIYSGNNPVGNSDPSGRDYCDISIQLVVVNIGWIGCTGDDRLHFYAHGGIGLPGVSVTGSLGSPSCESRYLSGGSYGAAGSVGRGSSTVGGSESWFGEFGIGTPGVGVWGGRTPAFCP
jgi:RHS repeat-associated protein